jgi:hypothetical protein
MIFKGNPNNYLTEIQVMADEKRKGSRYENESCGENRFFKDP